MIKYRQIPETQKFSLSSKLSLFTDLYNRKLNNYSLEGFIEIIKVNILVETEYKFINLRCEYLKQLPLFTEAYYRVLKEETNKPFEYYAYIRSKFYTYMEYLLLNNKQDFIISLIADWPKFSKIYNKAIVEIFKDIEIIMNKNQSYDMIETPLLFSTFNLTQNIFTFAISNTKTLTEKIRCIYNFYVACYYPRGSGESYELYLKKRLEIIRNEMRSTFLLNRGFELDMVVQEPEILKFLCECLEEIEKQNYILDLYFNIENPYSRRTMISEINFSEISIFPRLYETILKETDEDCQILLCYKLAKNRPSPYIEEKCIPELLNSQNPKLCCVGLQILTQKMLPNDFYYLKKLFLTNLYIEIKSKVVKLLTNFSCQDSADILSEALTNPELLIPILEGLRYGNIKDKNIVKILLKYLEANKSGPRNRTVFGTPTLLDLIMDALLGQDKNYVLYLIINRKEPIYLELIKKCNT